MPCGTFVVHNSTGGLEIRVRPSLSIVKSYLLILNLPYVSQFTEVLSTVSQHTFIFSIVSQSTQVRI